MFEKFDRSRLALRPLEERVHDISISIVKELSEPIEPMTNPHLDTLARAVVEARKIDSTVLLMYGAHVIRSGCALWMIELMKRGLVTHFATNGAGSIHDFEFAMIGSTCESVARYVSEGQFGLWNECGLVNEAIQAGVKEGLGAGEAIGKYIWENNFPNREKSVLAMGYHLRVPCTVHIGIGNDIIHELPNCSGAALGEASYTDFLIYTHSIEKLEGGVFLNFGSAVAGPEVYLKAISMCRNAAHQEGKAIRNFTTAVFDLLPLEGADYHTAPPKSDPRYYFRPWKTILARTVADGGRSFYVQGEHAKTLPNLGQRILKLTDAQN